jgi:hypothetical protein
MQAYHADTSLCNCGESTKGAHHSTEQLNG